MRIRPDDDDEISDDDKSRRRNEAQPLHPYLKGALWAVGVGVPVFLSLVVRYVGAEHSAIREALADGKLHCEQTTKTVNDVSGTVAGLVLSDSRQDVEIRYARDRADRNTEKLSSLSSASFSSWGTVNGSSLRELIDSNERRLDSVERCEGRVARLEEDFKEMKKNIAAEQSFCREQIAPLVLKLSEEHKTAPGKKK